MKMEVKMAPGAPFSLFFCLMEKACNSKGRVAVAFPPALNPDFLYAALDATVFAAKPQEARRSHQAAQEIRGSA
jgi:hypothetical protein